MCGEDSDEVHFLYRGDCQIGSLVSLKASVRTTVFLTLDLIDILMVLKSICKYFYVTRSL